MNTLILNSDHIRDIGKAGELLRNGGLVGIPTETVYGLAANALDGEAVKKIFRAKGRPADNPLIVHISSLSQLPPLVREIPESAEKLAAAFWPGPLTMVFKRSALIPDQVSCGLDTVAVRFPAHPAAQAVIDAAGVPLAAPSANRSGRPSPTTFSHLREEMEGRADALLDGGDCGVGVESTVITLAEGTPRVLRPGGITLAQLRSVLGTVEVDDAVLHCLKEGEKASSPGMKYKHYSPRAEVFLVDASPEEFSNYVNQKENCHALCFEEDVPLLSVPFLSYGSRYDGREQARRLFSALHALDEMDAGTVYAHMPSKRGIGLAVFNRLIRAAGFQVILPTDKRIVGLTGPSGAGKTAVGELFGQAGWAVIDCDALTRDPAVYDSACVQELQEAFGSGTAPGGVLDRKELARRAFSSPENTKKLTDITFPRILSRVRACAQDAFRGGASVVLLDAPTLFESGLDSACCRIVTVTAPKEVRLARVMARDGISGEQAELRFSAQKESSFYEDRSDWVIRNAEGGLPEEAVSKILDELGVK